jgi:hypothetical protein
LRLSEAQVEILSNMFEGPLFLKRLISLEASPPATLDAAAAFLDRHWQRLVPFLFRRGAGQTPSSVEHLILHLAEEDCSDFTINFSSHCLFTVDRQVQLPIPGLGLIDVFNRGPIEEALKKYCHTGAFGLLGTGSEYFVLVDFVPRSQVVSPNKILPAVSTPPKKSKPHPHRPAPRPTPRVTPSIPLRRPGMTARDFLNAFDNRVTQFLQQQLAISRQYTTTRFEDLSGWGVSGGLPSLPRRR